MDKELSRRASKKAINKESIISAAEKLFLQKGFVGTFVDDISKEAGFTIHTIYRYFVNKEDLFFAVLLKWSKQNNAVWVEELKYGRNGLDKIRLTNKVYYQAYINNPEMFRLMNYLPENRLNCEKSTHYNEMGLMKDQTIKCYMDIINEGKADGSINPNLDTKNTVFFEFCSLIGLLYMIPAMAKSYFWQEDGVDESGFLHFSMDLLANALK